MKILTQQEAQQVLTESRKFYTDFTVSLNGMLDKLPEPIRSSIAALKDKANAVLEKLPLTDAVPAAQETNWALHALAHAWQRQQELIDALKQSLDKYGIELTTKEASLNTRVTEAITAKVNGGELFEKTKVDGMVEAAQNKGRELALNEVKLIETRRKDFATCSLPMPVDDKFFLGDDAAFAAFKKTTQDRVKVLEGKGLSLNKAPKLVGELAFSGNFDRDLANVEETMKLVGGRRADPTLGGSGDKGARKIAAC